VICLLAWIPRRASLCFELLLQRAKLPAMWLGRGQKALDVLGFRYLSLQ